MLGSMTDEKTSSAAGMSDGTGIQPPSAPPERRGPPPNPLYHPLFLPVLLVAFMLWFFWDGFLTTDPEMLKHQTFNRVFFGLTLLFCLRVVPRGIREFREGQEGASRGHRDGRNP
jgi:hypothetical protein